MAFPRSSEERRVGAVIGRVHGSSRAQKHPAGVRVPAVSRQVERRLAFVGLVAHLGVVLQEQPADVRVPAAGRRVERGPAVVALVRDLLISSNFALLM